LCKQVNCLTRLSPDTSKISEIHTLASCNLGYFYSYHSHTQTLSNTLLIPSISHNVRPMRNITRDQGLSRSFLH